MHLENADPVAAGPPMVWFQAVVALHSGLGEVELPHISKHHRGLLLHENVQEENTDGMCSSFSLEEDSWRKTIAESVQERRADACGHIIAS